MGDDYRIEARTASDGIISMLEERAKDMKVSNADLGRTVGWDGKGKATGIFFGRRHSPKIERVILVAWALGCDLTLTDRR